MVGRQPCEEKCRDRVTLLKAKACPAQLESTSSQGKATLDFSVAPSESAQACPCLELQHSAAEMVGEQTAGGTSHLLLVHGPCSLSNPIEKGNSIHKACDVQLHQGCLGSKPLSVEGGSFPGLIITITIPPFANCHAMQTHNLVLFIKSHLQTLTTPLLHEACEDQ